MPNGFTTAAALGPPKLPNATELGGTGAPKPPGADAGAVLPKPTTAGGAGAPNTPTEELPNESAGCGEGAGAVVLPNENPPATADCTVFDAPKREPPDIGPCALVVELPNENAGG